LISTKLYSSYVLEDSNPKKTKKESPIRIIEDKNPKKRHQNVSNPGYWSLKVPKKASKCLQSELLETKYPKKSIKVSPIGAIGDKMSRKKLQSVSNQSYWRQNIPTKASKCLQ
jgi:hypothetical protein